MTSGLITRRSQVQILSPPPKKALVGTTIRTGAFVVFGPGGAICQRTSLSLVNNGATRRVLRGMDETCDHPMLASCVSNFAQSEGGGAHGRYFGPHGVLRLSGGGSYRTLGGVTFGSGS